MVGHRILPGQMENLFSISDYSSWKENKLLALITCRILQKINEFSEHAEKKKKRICEESRISY